MGICLNIKLNIPILFVSGFDFDGASYLGMPPEEVQQQFLQMNAVEHRPVSRGILADGST